MEKVLLVEGLNLTGKTWIVILEEEKIKMGEWGGRGSVLKCLFQYDFVSFFYFRFLKCSSEN